MVDGLKGFILTCIKIKLITYPPIKEYWFFMG